LKAVQRDALRAELLVVRMADLLAMKSAELKAA
jgi:hypothetical protein